MNKDKNNKNNILSEAEEKILSAAFADVKPLYKLTRKIPEKTKKKIKHKNKLSDHFSYSTSVFSKKDPDEILDLHGMNLSEAYYKLCSFIEANSEEKNKNSLLIITGKGQNNQGILQREVPLWLESPKLKKYIKSIKTAPEKQGGSGALLIKINTNL